MLHEFLGAAFPWIVIGLFAAFACAFLGKRKNNPLSAGGARQR